jgi:hypothetical protein
MKMVFKLGYEATFIHHLQKEIFFQALSISSLCNGNPLPRYLMIFP